MADGEEQIRTLIERWAEAVHSGDMSGVLADHSDDIVMFDVPPPHEGVRGIDAYRETWRPFFEWQAQGASFEIVSLDVLAMRWPMPTPCCAAGRSRNSPTTLRTACDLRSGCARSTADGSSRTSTIRSPTPTRSLRPHADALPARPHPTASGHHESPCSSWRWVHEVEGERGETSRPSSRMVHGSIVSIRRWVSLHGSPASVARTASSDSASTACTTRSSSASGPPRTIKPASTSASMNDACAGQSDCSSSGRDLSQHGPERRSTTRNDATLTFYRSVGAVRAPLELREPLHRIHRHSRLLLSSASGSARRIDSPLGRQ